MATANLPVLYQNVMMGLSTDLGKDAFLWATERPQNDRMCYWAEGFAHEAERLYQGLMPMLAMAKRVHEAQRGDTIPNEVMDDLMSFILTRHANWHCEGNVKPTYVNQGA